MWQYVYDNKVRKEKSIEYNCKEIIKQTRKKIKNFFDKIFESYAIQQIIRMNNKLYISLDSTVINNFCEDLFFQFKSEFPDMVALSVDSLFLNEYAEKIIITIPLYDIIIGGLEIELNNLINCQEVDKFMLFRQPLGKNEIDAINNNSVDEDDTLYNAYRVIGNLNSLSLFYNHTTAVMHYIRSYSKDTLIQETVFYNWCKEGAKLHGSVIEDIIDSLKKLNNVIPLELHESYQIIISTLNDYKAISGDIVKVDDIGQINDVATQINQAIVTLLDKCNFV